MVICDSLFRSGRGSTSTRGEGVIDGILSKSFWYLPSLRSARNGAHLSSYYVEMETDISWLCVFLQTSQISTITTERRLLRRDPLLEIIMTSWNYTSQSTPSDNTRLYQIAIMSNDDVFNRNSFVKINLHRKRLKDRNRLLLCVFRYTIENKIEVSSGICRGVALRWFPGEKNASAGRRRRRSLDPRGFLNDPYGRRRAKGGPASGQ